MILKIIAIAIAIAILATIFIIIGVGGFMFFFEKSFDIEEGHPLKALIFIILALIILIGSIIAPIYIGEKLNPNKKLECPKCEEAIEVEDKFCSNCGYKLMENNSIEDNYIYK